MKKKELSVSFYKGKPVLCLNPEAPMPWMRFNLGESKVNMILEKLDVLKQFQDEYGTKPSKTTTKGGESGLPNKTVTFVKKKVKSLKNIKNVKTFYNKNDEVSKYAIEYAKTLFNKKK